jgi:hypothetical protein
MAVVILDGRVRVTWATTISNIALPTTAELNAGTSLEGFITPDGLNINVSTNGVDTSNLGSTFTTMRAGRKGFDISTTFHHDGTVDTAWNLFPYRTNGYLVVRMGIDKATAWTAAQQVKVYPLESAEPSEVPPKPDSVWDFTVQFFLTSDPNTRAVVA